MLEVLEPGLLTTVQDAGRPDWTHLGVPVGGACDRWSLAVANLVIGNDGAAAALEMTLVGPRLEIVADVIIGLAGADLGGVAEGTGRHLTPGRAHRLVAGDVITFPGGSDRRDPLSGGCRAYLALPGGVDVPAVLGSRSTAIAAGFGGFEGRPVRTGDALRGAAAAAPAQAPVGETAWPELAAAPGPPGLGPIRVLPGPAPGLEALVGARWAVGPNSDRVGLRLDGPSIEPRLGGELLSHGVVQGAIQAPPSGGPIILLADGQPTGGYPVIAVVITADHPRLGQFRSGDRVSFAVTTLRVFHIYSI